MSKSISATIVTNVTIAHCQANSFPIHSRFPLPNHFLAPAGSLSKASPSIRSGRNELGSEKTVGSRFTDARTAIMIWFAGTWYLPPASVTGPVVAGGGKGSMLKPGAAAERRSDSLRIASQYGSFDRCD